MTHKNLQCEGFSSTYSKLNDVSSINTTRMELALSLIALGPRHRPHQLTGAFWWSLRGVVTVFSLLDAQLRPTVGFKSQTASHLKTDAFVLAEALTRWFAQRHLKATLVVPVEAQSVNFTRVPGSSSYPKLMPKYFRHAKKPSPKTEPDFFAFRTLTETHVLESKGRAGFAAHGVTPRAVNAARNKGLRQVCAIQAINGILPKTRSACVFAFDQVGLKGQVTDPPTTAQFRGEIPFPQLIAQSYAPVLDPLFANNWRQIDLDYVGIEFIPGWKFGIHKNILKELPNVKDADSFKYFLDLLENLPKRDGRETSELEDRSYSSDGFVLIGDPRTFKEPIRGSLCR